MKKYAPIILPLILFKLVVQWLGNRNYGFHRDELLHLSASEHLDWGYFEFPPFIAFLGKLSYLFFDYSLEGTRLFATLAGVFILILTMLMAKEMGGKRLAVFIAGISILAFVPYYRNHTLFQPVAFDQFFWTLGFYLMLRFINSNNKRDLLLLGLVAGFGLLNKYTMLVWGFGITIGFIFHNRGEVFKNKWLYLSGLLAFVVFLPNLIWQIQNGIPFFDHMAELQKTQLDQLSLWDFPAGQLEIIPTLGISFLGLGAFFLSSGLKKYRSLGVSFLVIFGVMWILKAKPYYFFGAYPVVFAAGAVQFESWFKKRPVWSLAFSATMLFPALYFIPTMTPILPINTFINWYNIPENNGRYELTSDYADMFGWEEQVAVIDSIYTSLPDSVQSQTVIWAENYGEAGALTILGEKHGLPKPISRHGSFWFWGFGNPDAQRWISLGNEEQSVSNAFHNCVLIRKLRHPYSVDEENGIPVYMCENPKVDIPKWWADYRDFVFQ